MPPALLPPSTVALLEESQIELPSTRPTRPPRLSVPLTVPAVPDQLKDDPCCSVPATVPTLSLPVMAAL